MIDTVRDFILYLKLCNRTKEGKFKGRLKKYHKNHAGMNYAVKLYKEGNMTVNQICEITNVSRASLYRKLSEVNN
ncbi:helix-turn-helix domain-containing protein [Enterococcus faecium]